MLEISIIIPMYNASRFIEQCLRSVIGLADVEKEIIVVDDGSSDSSVEIVKKIFSEQVTLVKKENGGASSARNLGLKKAQGKYVMFIDADDWLEDDRICRKCIDKAERDNLQMCIFNYKYFNNETHNYIDTTPINDNLLHCENVVDTVGLMVSSGLFPASPCFRIIERQFLIKNELFFIENTTAEDVEWFTHVLSRISRFGFIKDASYVYRKNVCTSVTGSVSPVKCENLLNRIKDAIEHTNGINNEYLKNALLSALAYEYCILLGNIAQSKEGLALEQKAKQLSFLLNYRMFPRITYISWVYKIFGLEILIKLMGIYVKRYAKSKSK